METLSQGKSSFAERSKKIAKSFLIAGSLSATAFSAAAIENDANNVNLLDDNTYQQSIESFSTGKSKLIEDSDYVILHTQNLEYESLKDDLEKHGVDFSDVEEFFSESIKRETSKGVEPNKNFVDNTDLSTANGKEILLHNTSTAELNTLSNIIKQKNSKLTDITSKFIVQHELAHLEDTTALFHKDDHDFSNQHEIYADLKGIQKVFQSEDLTPNERKHFLKSIIDWRKSGTKETVQHNVRDNHTTHFALEALANYYEANNYSMDSVHAIDDKKLYNFSENITQIDFTHNITEQHKNIIIKKKQDLLTDPFNISANPLLHLNSQATLKSIQYDDEGNIIGMDKNYKLKKEDIYDILSERVNNGQYKLDIDYLANKLEGKSVDFFDLDKKNNKIQSSEAMSIFEEATKRFYENKENFTLDEPEISLLSFNDLSLQNNISNEVKNLFQNTYNQDRLTAQYQEKLDNDKKQKSKNNNSPKPNQS
tara:strand:- start:18827 stop:20272 length:1446 start_codon:yes stop_codon:yes gene_type:complete